MADVSQQSDNLSDDEWTGTSASHTAPDGGKKARTAGNGTTSILSTIVTVAGALTEIAQNRNALVFPLDDDSDLSPAEQHDVIFVMFPGNPGACRFYDTFAEALFEASEVPVVTVSHAGHATHAEARADPNVYSLAFQLRHKRGILAAVQRHHPNARLIVGGHSIGAWMALELLREVPGAAPVHEAIDQVVGLFPTLHSLGDNCGPFLWTASSDYARPILAGLVGTIGAVLPKAALETVVTWTHGTSPSVASVAVDCLAYKYVQNMLFMAGQEFTDVALDEALVAAHADKLVFHYGMDDRWSPVESHFAPMHTLLSGTGGRAILDRNGIPHAFVEQDADAVTVALAVADYIKPVVEAATALHTS